MGRALLACFICSFLISSMCWPKDAPALGLSGSVDSSSPFSGQLVIDGAPNQTEQVRAARESERMNPDAQSAREESQTRYRDLGVLQAKQLLGSTYPELVNDVAGGPPQLSGSMKATGFPTDETMSVDLGSGRSGVVQSFAPIAVKGASGKREAIDLVPVEMDGNFRPRVTTAQAQLEIPKQMSSGVLLRSSGVSLTPVSSDESALAGNGAIDGAGVFYGRTEDPTAGIVDLDTLVKPTTFGFSMESVLRSEQAPQQLLFRVGLPAGAKLVQDTSGAVVIDDGELIARIPRPDAYDAEGTPVPTSMSVDGDLLRLAVEHREGSFRYPVIVDPEVTDKELLLPGNWAFAANSGDFTSETWLEFEEGKVVITSLIIRSNIEGGSYENGQFGILQYPTQHESRIYQFFAHTQQFNNPLTEDIEAYAFIANAKKEIENIGGKVVTLPFSGTSESTLCVEAGCAAGSVAEHHENFAELEEYARANGSGSFAIELEAGSFVLIAQEKGPSVSVDTGDAGFGAALNGAFPARWTNGNSDIGVVATDPGIGISDASYSSPQAPGWGHGFQAAPGCQGAECNECWNWSWLCAVGHSTGGEPLTYSLSGLPDGKDTVEVKVENATGEAAATSATVLIDKTAPHDIALTGLPAEGELGAGEYALKAEATDGTEPTASSGVKSLTLYVDGRQVSIPSGSCSPGPCTAHSSGWTLAGRSYATGRHVLTVIATDNVGNVATAEFPFTVRPAAPVAIGPGSVSPVSGELSLSTTDVAMGGGLTVARSYQSRHLTAGAEGPLGPQWDMSIGGNESLVKEPNGSMVLTEPDGKQVIFAETEGSYTTPNGDANLSLTTTPCEVGATEYMLTDSASKSTTCFIKPSGGGGQVWVPHFTKGAAPADTITYLYTPLEGTDQYTLPAGSDPTAISTGPEGNIWFTDHSTNKIGKITRGGAVTEYALPAGSQPAGIVEGPDENLWFTEPGTHKIGYITPTGALTEYPLSSGGSPTAIASGPDGDLWFTEYSSSIIGKVTTAGTVTEYSLPENSLPSGIATGLDHNLWFTDSNTSKIGRITPTGSVTEYALSKEGSLPGSIAVGPDGNLWFTEGGTNSVGEITTSGTIKEFSLPSETDPQGIVAGSDGNLWMAGSDNKVEKMTTAGSVTAYPVPSKSGPDEIAAGSDGNLWFAESEAGRIGKITTSGTIVEPTVELAPVPRGVSCTPEELKPGCRALRFTYSKEMTAEGEAPTEWGNYAGRLQGVSYETYSVSGKKMTETPIAEYGYDRLGRLRAEWDPRVSPALKALYGYSEEGALTVATPPGEQPWVFNYGVGEGDTTGGRLLSVMRPNASTPLGNEEVLQNTVEPTLSSAEVEAGLATTVSNGTWSGGPLDYSYQWEDCNSTGAQCTPIPDAVNQTYTPTIRDDGHRIRATVTATNSVGSVSVSTDASGEIEAYGFERDFGSTGEGEGQLKHPRGLTVDAKDDIWVADTENNRIEEFGPSGEYRGKFGAKGTGNGQLEKPRGLAIDKKGNFYVADTGNSRIEEFNEAGEYVSQFRKAKGTDELVEPSAIAYASASERLWVLNPKDSLDVVDSFTLGGTSLSESFGTVGTLKFGGYFEEPSGIAIDSKSHPWVSNTAEGYLENCDTAPVCGLVGSSGTGDGQFILPKGLAFDASGDAWIADSGNDRIQRLSSSGSYMEQYGTKGSGGKQFEDPTDVTVDSKGNVYVTDLGNNRVAKLAPAPITEPGVPTPPNPGTSSLWTVEYSLPLTGSHLPTMTSGEVSKWAQKDDPAEGFAVFPPDKPEGWPANSEDYEHATIYYVDDLGRIVNIKRPGGGISTTEYNANNDVERSLTADNRATALKEGANSGEASESLETWSSYNSDGTELLSTLGPQHIVKLANGEEVEARSHTVYSYDEGAPETGETYRLVTKVKQGAAIKGRPEADVRTSLTSYSGQEGLGWKLRKPTSTITDPAGLDLVHTTVYDKETGDVVETKSPGGTSSVVYPPEDTSSFGSLGSGSGQFKEPEGVAVDSSGDLWVTDSEDQRVEEFSAEGTYMGSFVSKGSGEEQLVNPWGIAVNQSTGDVYVSDSANDRVVELSPSRTFVRTIGSSGSGNGDLSNPLGLTVDAHGNVWVADAGNDRVEEFSETGSYESQFGETGSGDGQLNVPFGLTISEGELFVVDQGNERIEEFAPNGTYLNQFGSEGSLEGEFKEPRGIATNPATGILYVSDAGNERVQEFSPAGKPLADFGFYGSGNDEFHGPTGIALDSTGKLYVADKYNARIDEWTLPGAGGARLSYSGQTGTTGSGNGQFSWPFGVAVDGDGNVWVSEIGNSRIQELSASGQFIAKYGSAGSGNGQFNAPLGIAINQSTGDVYIADCGNNRVQELNEKGEFVRKFGTYGSEAGQLSCPTGVKIDSSGNVWVADSSNNRVEEFSSSGSYLAAYGSYGTGNGQFKEPSDIAFSGGHMYVTDFGNDRVQELSMAGEFIRKFGREGQNSGELDNPEAISADAAGNLYVLDHWNDRVEEFSNTGTFLASFGESGSGEGQLNKPNGMAITAAGELLVADSADNRIETWMPADQAVHDTRTVYYTAGEEAEVSTCRKHPEWAGLPCQTEPAAQPETPGLPGLPVTSVTYNMWEEPETTVESVGSDNRTTTVTYDAAGRVVSTHTTSTEGGALPTVTDHYSTATGTLIEQSATIEGKAETVKSTFNSLEQLTAYTDADEVTTEYEYEGEKNERLIHVNDGKGTQSYKYDGTTGSLVELTDVQGSNTLTFGASYDAEGNLTSESYPNGMSASYTLNPAGESTSLSYTKTTHCTEKCTWLSDSVISSIHAQILEQESTTGKESYVYDEGARLTQVQETPAEEGCTTRLYTYDEETDRTSLTTRAPGIEGACASEGGAVQHHFYDGADRLTDAGVNYDQFGDIIKVPAADAGGSELSSTFYADGQLEYQMQNGQGITYRLDPSGRTREAVDTGTVNSTTISHYMGDSDTPAWSIEPVSGHWTRYVSGMTGYVALEASVGSPVLELTDLEGNVVATASVSETATKLLSTERFTEYGVPTTPSPERYGWLGGSLSATELPSGVVAMGARSYVSAIGQFLQTDPVPGGSANPYAYTYGDPLDMSDPSGEYTAVTTGAGMEVAAESGAAIEAERRAAEEAAARAEAERIAAEAAMWSQGIASEAPEPEEGFSVTIIGKGHVNKSRASASILKIIKEATKVLTAAGKKIGGFVVKKVTYVAQKLWAEVQSNTVESLANCYKGATAMEEALDGTLKEFPFVEAFALSVGCGAETQGGEVDSDYIHG